MVNNKPTRMALPLNRLERENSIRGGFGREVCRDEVHEEENRQELDIQHKAIKEAEVGRETRNRTHFNL